MSSRHTELLRLSAGLAELAVHERRLPAGAAGLELRKSAERTGLRARGKVFPALLAEAFGDPPLHELVARKKLLLEYINEEKGCDDRDSDDRAALHAELEASIAEAEAGQTESFSTVLAELRQRL